MRGERCNCQELHTSPRRIVGIPKVRASVRSRTQLAGQRKGLLMRPRGEIRQALFSAARSLHEERGHFTWIDMAEKAQVGYDAARVTVKNMASAGELVRVGSHKPEGSRVWVTLFEPAAEPESATEAEAQLSDVVRCWAEFV